MKNLTLFIHVIEFVITLFGIHHPVHFLRRFFSFSFSRWRSFWVYRCRCNTIASVHLHFWVRKIYAAHWFGVAWVTHYLLNCSAFNFGKNIYVQYHLCSGLLAKILSISSSRLKPYKLFKISICVTFHFYGNPSLNGVSFFKSTCTSIYCKNSFFACAKTSRKVFAKILSVSLHSFIFVPWLLLLTFVGSSLTFSLDRKKGI